MKKYIILFAILLLFIQPVLSAKIDPYLKYLAKKNPSQYVVVVACKDAKGQSCAVMNITAGEIFNLSKQYPFILPPPRPVLAGVSDPLRYIGIPTREEQYKDYFIWYNIDPSLLGNKNVTIAIVDTGTTPEHWWFKKLGVLLKYVKAYWDGSKCVYTSGGEDTNGHGTAVSGTIASIVPKAKLIVVQLGIPSLYPTPVELQKSYLCALRYAAEHADIISISLELLPGWYEGYSMLGFELSNPVCALIDKYPNKVFVVAAGNYGLYNFTKYVSGESSLTAKIITYKNPIYLLIKWKYPPKRVDVYFYNGTTLIGKVKWDIDRYVEENVDLLYYGCVNGECVMHIGFDNDEDYENITVKVEAGTPTDILLIDLYAIPYEGRSPQNTVVDADKNHTIILYPAVCKNAITVGAYDTKHKKIADFSSIGTFFSNKPEIYAPGVDIYVPIPTGATYLSGTSLATPITASSIAMGMTYFKYNTREKVMEYLEKYSTQTSGVRLINVTKLKNDLPHLVLVTNTVESTRRYVNVTIRNPSTFFPCHIYTYNTTVPPSGETSILLELPYQDPGNYIYNLSITSSCGTYNFALNVTLYSKTTFSVNMSGWSYKDSIYTLYYKIIIEHPTDFRVPVYLYIYTNNTLTHKMRYLLDPDQRIVTTLPVQLNKSKGDIYNITFVLYDAFSKEKYTVYSDLVNLSALKPYRNFTLSVSVPKYEYYVGENITIIVKAILEKYEKPVAQLGYTEVRIRDIVLRNILKEGTNVLRVPASLVGVGNYTMNVRVKIGDEEFIKSFNITIKKPDVKCTLRILNTNNQTYYGTNSKLLLSLYAHPDVRGTLESNFYNGTVNTGNYTFSIKHHDGKYTLWYKWYIDRVTLCKGVLNITIDTHAPTLKSKIYVSNGSIVAEFNVTDNYCLYNASLIVNGTVVNETTLNGTTYSGILTYKPKNEGIYNVTLKVEDCARNVVKNSTMLLYDNTPPKIIVLEPREDLYYAYGVHVLYSIKDFTPVIVYINSTKTDRRDLVLPLHTNQNTIINITAIDSAHNVNTTIVPVKVLNFTKFSDKYLTPWYCYSPEYGYLKIENVGVNTWTGNITVNNTLYEVRITEYIYKIDTNTSDIYCEFWFVPGTGEDVSRITINGKEVNYETLDWKVHFSIDQAGVLNITTTKLLGTYTLTQETTTLPSTSPFTITTQKERSTTTPTSSNKEENKDNIPVSLIFGIITLVGVLGTILMVRKLLK